jgi:hypothetical protein
VTDEIFADIQRMLDTADPPPAAAKSDRPPISGYDNLSAPQVQERLDDLSPVQLRWLRDYEQRNANRKTVLERIDRKLRST